MSDQAKKIEEQIGEKKEAPLTLEEIGQQKREEAPIEVKKDKIDKKLNKAEREEQAIEGSRRLVEKTVPKNMKEALGTVKPEVRQHAKGISEIEDVQEQIAKLVDLAQHKDPFLAIKVASHLDNNYVLDSVHDQLLEEKIKKILIEKGLLKEV